EADAAHGGVDKTVVVIAVRAIGPFVFQRKEQVVLEVNFYPGARSREETGVVGLEFKSRPLPVQVGELYAQRRFHEGLDLARGESVLGRVIDRPGGDLFRDRSAVVLRRDVEIPEAEP